MDWIQIKQVINVLLCLSLARFLYKDIKNQLKGKNRYEVLSFFMSCIAIGLFLIVIVLLTGGLSL